MALKTPVAFCIYNRPELTERVFAAISRQQPARLFVIADGAKETKDGDPQNVAATRKIIDRIDWRCELVKEYSDTNLGCRSRMASGISAAFEWAEELIILEDDCVPDDSFFGFCEELLDRYRDEEQVMAICGTRFNDQSRSNSDYFFSRWPHIWGWASWRRAWDHYNVDMPDWPAVKARAQLESSFAYPGEAATWNALFDDQQAGNIDTWDFPWMYACWMNNGLTIHPPTNLVTNVGFGIGATHTHDADAPFANLPTCPVNILTHPQTITRDLNEERWTWENIFSAMQPAAAPACKPDPPRVKRWLNRLTSPLTSSFRRAKVAKQEGVAGQ